MQQRKDSSGASDWFARMKARDSAADAVPGIPRDLAHGIDKYGSLVTVGPADWMICFVRGLQKQWWHRFVNKKHKHVFAMRPTETGSWVLVEPWWTRMMITVLPSSDAVRYLRWGATGDILRVREEVPGHGNQARGWSNCAVLTAFVLGRSSHSWTPHGLYLELLNDKSVQRQDVEDLLVEQVEKVVGKSMSDALRLGAESLKDPIELVLEILGRSVLTTMTSSAVSELCHTAIVEAERYPRASLAYNEKTLKPAVLAVMKILEAAQAKGEITVPDPQVAAGQFVAMLRGNLHLQTVMEVHEPPSQAEVEERVKSVVEMFLHGVRPT